MKPSDESVPSTQKVALPNGGQGTVIAWLWAGTVRSPDPAAKNAMVPLVASFMLSTRAHKILFALGNTRQGIIEVDA
jgi:hypothetical protein